MTETTKKAAKANTQSPAEALTAAVEALVAAAETYAASDETDTRAFTAGDYRVRFQGEQLLRVDRV